MNDRRINILEVHVDNYESQELISQLESGFGRNSTQTIFSINPEKIIRTRKDPGLFSALKEADYLIPDGIGVVLGIRLLHGTKINRITGIDLMNLLLQTAHKREYRVFLFGARPGVNLKAAAEIRKRYPSLKLVGNSHGYIEERLYDKLVQRINSLETDILFVGMGSPKQEKWVHNHKKFLKVKICMGIGGSLDVMARHVQRAPQYIQRMGLEWLFRAIQDPKKYKRLVILPQFIFELAKKKLDYC